MQKEIGEIKKLLDSYFSTLTNAIFQDKSLVIPEKYK
jgi:hypothetical protein